MTNWRVRLRRCISLLALFGLYGYAPAIRASGSSCLPELAPRGTRILVFYRVEGAPYHESIPKGLAAVEALGRQHRFLVDESDDPRVFNDRQLRRYAAVVFLNTIGNVLDGSQEAAFERYMRRGGGFVGIHAAAHTEFDWPWYGQLVGAWYQTMTGPWIKEVKVVDRTNLSTRCIPPGWRPNDEWYDYRALPTGVHILATIDGTWLPVRADFSGGHEHPIVWQHEFDSGRAWYTALGHTEGVYSDSVFLDHLAGGILWASGR